MRRRAAFVTMSIACLLAAPSAWPQTSQKPTPSDVTTGIKRDLAQAEHGHCTEALPALKRDIHKIESRELRRQAGVDGIRCAMSLNQPRTNGLQSSEMTCLPVMRGEYWV